MKFQPLPLTATLALLGSLFLLSAAQVEAHSGRTDASGCHHDRQNGGYHCHNGGSSAPSSSPSYSPSSRPSSSPSKPSIPLNSPTNVIELPSRTGASSQLFQVVSVGDGDTIRVRSQVEEITVRLSCIDAPETAQNPWGEQSALRLRQILPPGEAVQLRVIERDRYGRTVAEVYRQSASVNLQMVKEGQAAVYPQYLYGCAATQNQYLQAEAQAKQQRLNFWNQATPVMPWEFRQLK